MQAPDSTAGTFQKRYFDLHTQGIGYLSRVRVVTPRSQGRRAEPMLCCAINALRGDVDEPQYTYFDLRVTEEEAQTLVRRCKPAVDAGKQVIVAFTIGDIYPHTYEKEIDGRTEVRAITKGRLIGVSYVKVDGVVVHQRAGARDLSDPQSAQAGADAECAAA